MLKLCFTYIKCFTVMKLPASLYPLNCTHCKLHSSILGDLISRGRSFWQSDWSKTWRQSSPPPGRALGSDKHGGRSQSLSLCLWAGPGTPGAPTRASGQWCRGRQRNPLTSARLHHC